MIAIESTLILYASDTGNAEDVAYGLYNTLLHNNIKNLTIQDVEDYNITMLSNKQNIIFIISTAGEGEVPPTMKSFWNCLLKRNLSASYLNQVSYTVFGLGDSSYEKFNAAARLV